MNCAICGNFYDGTHCKKCEWAALYVQDLWADWVREAKEKRAFLEFMGRLKK